MIKTAAAGQLSTKARAGTKANLRDVSENGDRPVLTGRIGEPPGDEPQTVTQ